MKKQMEETLEATREARTMQVRLATGYDLIPQSISSYQKKIEMYRHVKSHSNGEKLLSTFLGLGLYIYILLLLLLYIHIYI